MSEHYATLYSTPNIGTKQYKKRHDRVGSPPLHYMQGNKDKIRKGTLTDMRMYQNQ